MQLAIEATLALLLLWGAFEAQHIAPTPCAGALPAGDQSTILDTQSFIVPLTKGCSK